MNIAGGTTPGGSGSSVVEIFRALIQQRRRRHLHSALNYHDQSSLSRQECETRPAQTREVQKQQTRIQPLPIQIAAESFAPTQSLRRETWIPFASESAFHRGHLMIRKHKTLDNGKKISAGK
jgi:hypothetical protein